MVTGALLIAGNLFISPSHPAFLPVTSSSVWFSKADVARAREHQGKILIEPQKPGLVFAHGLKAGEAATRIVSLSDKNFEALARCPQISLEWSAPQGLAASEKVLTEARRCGFDELRISDSLRLKLERDLQYREAQLQSLGLLFHRAYWKNGERLVEVSRRSFEQFQPQIKFVLGAELSLYRWIPIEGPTPGRTLLFELTLFEYSRHKARQLGLSWPGRIPILALDGGAAALGRAKESGELITFADFGEAQGVGKVLAQPQLRCKPGEKATFHSGGELPIASKGLYQSKMEWKSYGLSLNVEPDANVPTGANEITLNFSLEASEPDPGSALGGIPGMSKRLLQSRFDLRTGEMTLLSTLLQRREAKNRAGIAVLSDIPLLSYLFSSENRRNNENEVWFAIRASWEEAPLKRPEDYSLHYEP
jgi:hypothetical protein